MIAKLFIKISLNSSKYTNTAYPKLESKPPTKRKIQRPPSCSNSPLAPIKYFKIIQLRYILQQNVSIINVLLFQYFQVLKLTKLK